MLTAEILKGIQSIHRGQTEVILNNWVKLYQTMRHVIPQAIRRILPPLVQFIYIKISAFASVIGMQELTRRVNEIVVIEYRPLEIYIINF